MQPLAQSLAGIRKPLTKGAIREVANLEARTDPKRFTKEPTRTVAGLFGIIQEPWHRKKFFDNRPPISRG
jgi:hypothetical protein